MERSSPSGSECWRSRSVAGGAWALTVARIDTCRPSAHNGSVFRRPSGLTVVAGLVPLLVPLLSPGCAPVARQEPSQQAVLRIGFPPGSARANATIGLTVAAWHLSGGGFLSIDPNGHYVPGLATSFEVAEDRLSVTLHLRPDARFPDGTYFTSSTAKDVLDELIGDPAQLVPLPLLEDVASIDTAGPHSVRFELRRPSGLWLDHLTVTPTRAGPDGREMGVGPYFIETQRSDRITLRANPYYYGGVAGIDTIHLRSFPTLRSAWAAMMRGEIDSLYEVPGAGREFLEQQSGVRLFPTLSSLHSIVFNVQRPMLRSAQVRTGLSMAIDRQEVVNVGLREYGRPAGSPPSPDHWARGEGRWSFDYQPLDALQRLGPVVPAGSRRPRALASRLRFTCLVPENVSPHDRVAMVVQAQLYDLGVDMAIEAVAPDVLHQRLIAGDFDAVLLDLNVGPGLARLHAFWHSSNVELFARTGYRGADAALQALRLAQGDDELRQAVNDVQQAFYLDPPAIFLGWSERTRAVAQQFLPPRSDRDVMATVAEWRVPDPSFPGR